MGDFGEISKGGIVGRAFLVVVVRAVVRTLFVFSEPEAGGVGGRARLGGGEGSRGVVSLFLVPSGLDGLDGVSKPERRSAARGMEADLGRGTAARLPLRSRRMSLAGFGVGLALGAGTSSATSITGLSAMAALSVERTAEVGV